MIVVPVVPALVLAGTALAAAPAPAEPPEGSPPSGVAAAAPQAGRRVWLGVFIENAVDGGIQIVDVVPGGPAARAGLARGDILIRAGSSDLATVVDLRKVSDGLAPGDTLSLGVLRDGNPRDVRLVVGSPPPAGWVVPRVLTAQTPEPPLPPEAPLPLDAAGLSQTWRSIGLAVEGIPPPLREHFGAPADAGILVTRVDPDGPAAGLVRAGDVLVRAGAQPLQGPDTLERLLLLGSSSRLRIAGVRDRAEYAAVVPVRATGPAAEARRERIRVLESSIRELEAALEAMRKELADLKSKR